jgi:hypothetical protein
MGPSRICLNFCKADVWSLPSCERVHAAIGKPASVSTPTLFTPLTERRGKTGEDFRGDLVCSPILTMLLVQGLIMSMHLFFIATGSKASSSSLQSHTDELRLLCAYENGAVTLWRYTLPETKMSIEGVGWEAVWTVKLHADTSRPYSPSHA